MFPVQVKVLSSSSCTLSEASSLLQLFVSSDACSDSFARDYAANVAQALQDSISRRAGSLESEGKHRHFSASSRSRKELGVGKQSSIVTENPASSSPSSKLHRDGKQSALVAKNAAPSGLGGTHTQGKQRLLDDVGQDAGVDVGVDAAMEAGSAMVLAENASRRHKKKRRHSAADIGLETVPPATLETEDSALTRHDKKRRRKEKHERETEFIETEDSAPDDQRRHSKKKRKDEQERETESLETKDPASENLHDKKKRRRERQGRDTEDMEASNYAGPPTSLSVDENLDMMSAVKGKKKADADNIDANKALEVGVSITPSSPNVEEHTGSSKRKRKEKKAGFLATPDEVPFLEKGREDADLEASPVEFESFTSGEMKKKKKKRRREEELGELVRQTLSD